MLFLLLIYKVGGAKEISKSGSMLIPEVDATILVSIGFAPSTILSTASSSKLDEVLMPDPFDDRSYTVLG